MARLCVSIPVHEQLPVVIDQIDNFRAFLPEDTAIVLHAAQGFCDVQRLQRIVPAGVFINPTQLQTRWGDVLPQHHANFRFMRGREPFDYFVVHASNDMFLLPGAGEYIVESDAGVQQHRFGPEDESVHLRRMVGDIGAEEIFHSQTEGTFYRADLFGEMIDIVEKYWPNDGSEVAPEEYYYPTVASTLTSSIALPYVHAESHWDFATHPVTMALIHAIRSRAYFQDIPQDVAQWQQVTGSSSMPPSDELDYDHVYAIKRVPREYWHPFRVAARTITREHRPKRLRLPIQGTEAAAFQVLTVADQAVTDPQLLRGFRDAFTDVDDVVLLVWVPQPAADVLLPQLVVASEQAGLHEPDAPRVEAVVLPECDETIAQLAWVADVFYSAVLPFDMSEMLFVRPTTARRLRDFYTTALYGRGANSLRSSNAATSSGVPS